MAFHVDCYTHAKGRAPAKSFTAIHNGTCVFAIDGKCLHGGQIKAGQAISWARRGYRASNVSNTAPVNASASTDVVDVDDPPASVSPAIVQPAAPSAPALPASSDPVAAALAAILLPLVQSQIDAKIGKLDPAKLVEAADARIQQRIAELSLPREVTVRKSETAPPVNMGRQHKQFPELLAYLASGQNVYIVGSAGTGKTTAVEKAFEALGKPLNALSSITDRHGEVYGYRDAHGKYQESLVFDAYTRGKGMLVDEIDGSEPGELLAFNQVTANGRASFCNVMAERHPECQFVATANTWGNGASAEYTGRARLDASTLDRFVVLTWDLDEELERATCSDAEWCVYVQSVRARVASKGMKHLVTPRASYKGAALLASLQAHGFSRAQAWEKAVGSVLRRNLSDDQWTSVR